MKKIAYMLAAGIALWAFPLEAADAPAKKPAQDAKKPVTEYGVLKDKSFLKFIATQNGAPVEGRFQKFDVQVKFDPEQLDRSNFRVEVDTASAEASYDEVSKNLKLPEWLSVEAFPKAIVTSGKINRMPSTDNYYTESTLELRGVKKPITLNFSLQAVDDKRMLVTGYATLSRKDFGVGQGQWAKDDVVRNDVRVEFRLVADKK